VDEKDKPITDAENFPKTEEAEAAKFTRLMVGVEQVAYLDGCADGYRKATQDFMMWGLAFFALSMLVSALYPKR
jgi:hypothetical protein